MEVIIFSRTLTSLQKLETKTSSQIFELEFAKSLAEKCNVNIISLKGKEKEEMGQLKLFPIHDRNLTKNNLNQLLNEKDLLTNKKSVVIVFGYDYFTLRIFKKKFDKTETKLISYTFDTHKGALEGRSILKKAILNLYFYLGIKKLNEIDGVILFKKQAYKELKLNIPYIISRIGINPEMIKRRNFINYKNENKIFKIVYAGSLEPYNGINEMIQAIKIVDNSIDNFNVRLEIYGDGSMKNFVEKEAENNNIVYYGGRVSKKEIEKVYLNTNLLINLRDTNHYVNKFSFPSKLIEYLSLGIPVLSTNLLEDNEFENSVFIVDDLEIENISEKIKHIIYNPSLQVEKAECGINFITDKFLWEEVIVELEGFINNLFDKSRGGDVL